MVTDTDPVGRASSALSRGKGRNEAGAAVGEGLASPFAGAGVNGRGGAWERVEKMLGRNRGAVEEEFVIQAPMSGSNLGGVDEEDNLWVDLDDDMPLTTYEGGEGSFLNWSHSLLGPCLRDPSHSSFNTSYRSLPRAIPNAPAFINKA